MQPKGTGTGPAPENIEQLRVKVTMKLHIVKDGHLEDFLSQLAGDVSLAAFTEQSFEHAHKEFAHFSMNFGVPADHSKHASTAVLHALSGWNAARLLPSEHAAFRSSGRGAGSLATTDSRNIHEGPLENKVI